MQKIYIGLIAFCLLALTGVCYAASWQSVTTFTGAADTKTDYFKVPTNEWRLTWSIEPSFSAELAVFGVFIYPKGEDMQYAGYAAKYTGSNQTSGTLYVHEGIKDYYLEISSANVQNYDVRIEYDSSAVPEFSSIALVVAIVLMTGIVLIVRKKMQNKN